MQEIKLNFKLLVCFKINWHVAWTWMTNKTAHGQNNIMVYILYCTVYMNMWTCNIKAEVDSSCRMFMMRGQCQHMMKPSADNFKHSRNSHGSTGMKHMVKGEAHGEAQDGWSTWWRVKHMVVEAHGEGWSTWGWMTAFKGWEWGDPKGI